MKPPSTPAGIVVLGLGLVFLGYAWWLFTSNPEDPKGAARLTVMYAGQYLLFAWLVMASPGAGIIGLGYVLIGLNALAFLMGGFGNSSGNGIVMVPVLVVSWILYVLASLFLFASLRTTAASERPNENDEDAKKKGRD